ncbi:MAG: TetR/AcrR family transcriptional regulator [Microbacterium sp.]|nr:MAG: TetR/AcrR family transcriptional regulator [Microbacterium sp.]
MVTTEQRPLRADAQRNLERITASARALFAQHGTCTQMEDIAAHAGVGVGTLYRRFPTKESLLTALVRERFQEFTVIAVDVEATTEPADALFTVMRRHAEAVEHDAAFQSAMMNLDSFSWEGIEDDKAALGEVLTRIIARAKKAGTLRKDFKFEEYGMLMCANTATMYFIGDKGDWRRHLQIVLDGLKPA